MFFERKSAFESKRVCKFHFVLFRVVDFGLRIQSELHSCFLIQKMVFAILKLRVVSFLEFYNIASVFVIDFGNSISSCIYVLKQILGNRRHSIF